jgi:hypothetical protein
MSYIPFARIRDKGEARNYQRADIFEELVGEILEEGPDELVHDLEADI